MSNNEFKFTHMKLISVFKQSLRIFFFYISQNSIYNIQWSLGFRVHAFVLSWKNVSQLYVWVFCCTRRIISLISSCKGFWMADTIFTSLFSHTTVLPHIKGVQRYRLFRSVYIFVYVVIQDNWQINNSQVNIFTLTSINIITSKYREFLVTQCLHLTMLVFSGFI
mgnify:CR=1 FL=1